MFFFSAFLGVFSVFFFPGKVHMFIHSFDLKAVFFFPSLEKKNSFFIHSIDFCRKCVKYELCREKKTVPLVLPIIFSSEKKHHLCRVLVGIPDRTRSPLKMSSFEDTVIIATVTIKIPLILTESRERHPICDPKFDRRRSHSKGEYCSIHGPRFVITQQ